MEANNNGNWLGTIKLILNRNYVLKQALKAVFSPMVAFIVASILLIPISMSTLQQQQVHAKGITPGNSTITFPPPTYKVTVKFDSIKVMQTHDPGIFTPEGDGEYDRSR